MKTAQIATAIALIIIIAILLPKSTSTSVNLSDPKREAPASLLIMRRRPVELDERPAAPASQPDGSQNRTPMWLWFVIMLQFVIMLGMLLIGRLLERD